VLYVFNATQQYFSYIVAVSLNLVAEHGASTENHWLSATSHWLTLSDKVVSSTIKGGSGNKHWFYR